MALTKQQREAARAEIIRKYARRGELVDLMYNFGLKSEERGELEVLDVELNAYEMEQLAPSLDAMEESVRRLGMTADQVTRALEVLHKTVRAKGK